MNTALALALVLSDDGNGDFADPPLVVHIVLETDRIEQVDRVIGVFYDQAQAEQISRLCHLGRVESFDVR